MFDVHTHLFVGIWSIDGEQIRAHSHFMTDRNKSENEMIDLAINKSEFDYVRGRRVYRKNVMLQHAIERGDYVYKQTAR